MFGNVDLHVCTAVAWCVARANSGPRLEQLQASLVVGACQQQAFAGTCAVAMYNVAACHMQGAPWNARPELPGVVPARGSCHLSLSHCSDSSHSLVAACPCYRVSDSQACQSPARGLGTLLCTASRGRQFHLDRLISDSGSAAQPHLGASAWASWCWHQHQCSWLESEGSSARIESHLPVNLFMK